MVRRSRVSAPAATDVALPLHVLKSNEWLVVNTTCAARILSTQTAPESNSVRQLFLGTTKCLELSEECGRLEAQRANRYYRRRFGVALERF